MQHTLSTYQDVVKDHNRFLSCQNCDRHKTRTKVCLWRGIIPADVLFVGLEPTVTEDTIGFPLLGIEGQILYDIAKAAIVFMQRQQPDYTFTYCMTYQLSCYNEEIFTTDLEIEACLPRLIDLIKTVNPRLIVLIGVDQLIPLQVQKQTPLEIDFLGQIPVVKMIDFCSLPKINAFLP